MDRVLFLSSYVSIIRSWRTTKAFHTRYLSRSSSLALFPPGSRGFFSFSSSQVSLPTLVIQCFFYCISLIFETLCSCVSHFKRSPAAFTSGMPSASSHLCMEPGISFLQVSLGVEVELRTLASDEFLPS